MEHKPKRKRGGQQGNQNARKHGFYSVNLNPREICEFWNIINLGGVEPELVALRIKLYSALRDAPGNRRVLREASHLLVKWYHSKYHFDRKDNAEFKKFVRNILKTADNTSGSFYRNES
jgi:hypothetical protein